MDLYYIYRYKFLLEIVHDGLVPDHSTFAWQKHVSHAGQFMSANIKLSVIALFCYFLPRVPNLEIQ